MRFIRNFFWFRTFGRHSTPKPNRNLSFGRPPLLKVKTENSRLIMSFIHFGQNYFFVSAEAFFSVGRNQNLTFGRRLKFCLERFWVRPKPKLSFGQSLLLRTENPPLIMSFILMTYSISISNNNLEILLHPTTLIIVIFYKKIGFCIICQFNKILRVVS